MIHLPRASTAATAATAATRTRTTIRIRTSTPSAATHFVFLLAVASCWSAGPGGCGVSAERWYSLICTTGRVQTFSSRDGTLSYVGDDKEQQQQQHPSSDHRGTGGRRSLLRGTMRPFPPPSFYENADDDDDLLWTPERATPAARMMRALQLVQDHGELFLDHGAIQSLDYGTNDNETSSSSSSWQEYRLRPCMCHPSQVQQRGADYYSHDGNHENTSTTTTTVVPDVYFCPETSDYCGIPYEDGEGDGPIVLPVGCFSITVQEVVARNAWPLILLWYIGMIIIGCFTVHGSTSWGYIRTTFWNRQGNSEIADRLLLSQQRTNTNNNNNNTASTVAAAVAASQPPTSYWNWWGWQRYRFEQNLLVQSEWMWRHEEHTRMEQERRQQLSGHLPPVEPRYEMKTKRFSRQEHNNNNNPEHTVQQDHGEQYPQDDPYDDQQEPQTDTDNDQDSLDEPTCAICFATLQDGELVGDLQCSHLFHKHCLKTWCARKNACPLCQTPIANRRITENHHRHAAAHADDDDDDDDDPATTIDNNGDRRQL